MRTAVPESMSSAELVVSTSGGSYHSTLSMPVMHVHSLFDIILGLDWVSATRCVLIDGLVADPDSSVFPPGVRWNPRLPHDVHAYTSSQSSASWSRV